MQDVWVKCAIFQWKFVLKTRAKPVTKTFHENFTVNFPVGRFGPVDFARQTDFLCVANFKTAMYLYENQSPPDRISLFSRRNFEG